MRLIPISPNILVNPEAITCIEQREVRGIDVTYVWLGDKHYILGYPVEELYKNLEEQGELKQYFAG